MILLKISSFVLLNTFVLNSESYRILALVPFPFKSHYDFVDPLLVKLAEKGHHVFVYNPFVKNIFIPNYTEYDTKVCPLWRMWNPFASIGSVAVPLGWPFVSMIRMAQISQPKMENLTECPPFNDLLNSNEKYDLLITESFHHDIFLIFSNKFQIPFITFIPNFLFPWHADRTQNPFNPSYVPDLRSGFLPKMAFLERVENTLIYLFSLFVYNGYILKKNDILKDQVLGVSSPSLRETLRNTSVIFINSHSSVNRVIPLIPGIVEVGGLHIKSVAVLPVVCIFVFPNFCLEIRS